MILLSSVQVALAYNETIVDGRTTDGGIIQSTFLESLMKHVGDIFVELPNLKDNLRRYLTAGRWPDAQNDLVILSWYLQWYSIPPPHAQSPRRCIYAPSASPPAANHTPCGTDGDREVPDHHEGLKADRCKCNQRWALCKQVVDCK
jgi:hypothetical protein